MQTATHIRSKHPAGTRRRAVGALLALLLGVGAQAPALAQAQWHGGKPVTVIVPFTPGNGVDLLARTLAQHLSPRWGTPAVVVNKSGASGNIGTDFVAGSSPDGLTQLMASTTFVINSIINKKIVRYDPLKSFEPVSLVATGTLALAVSEDTPARTVAEFVQLAKSKPGALNYASAGNGTPHHLSMELFKLETGVDLVHVPYKGTAEAFGGVAGRQVNAMMAPLHAALPYVKSGKFKLLAVLSNEREAIAPNVPTLKEEGFPNVEVYLWYGLFVPAGTPPEIIKQLNQGVNSILTLPEVHKSLEGQGLKPAGGAPQRLTDMLRRELTRWPRVVSSAGIKAD
jgi:tripartite-type tricarboxylate transporter receptor subunit TctC